MTLNLKTVATAIALAVATTISVAGEMKPQMHGSLEISQPWTRATPPNAPAGGGYVTITNTGSEPDRLVAASAAIAGRTEIHEMSMEGGVMKMRPLADGIAIGPGETVALKPGGFHIMMMKLSGPIKTGESLPITLSFEKAGDVTLEFVAAPIGSKTPPQ
jgi:copper(I)-binding protein